MSGLGRPAIAPAVLALLASGCIGLGADDLPPSSVPSVADIDAYVLTRLVQDHDHTALPQDHAGRIGFAAAAFAPGRDGAYPEGEVYSEVAVKAGYAFLAFGPRTGFVAPGQEAGFIIYDVSDAAAPVEVGRWIGQPLGDIEASDDGNWVFASTQRNGYPYPYTFNAEAGPTGHLPRGTYILDVSDKANPRFAGFAPLPTNGPHTITYYEMPDGRELLIQATYDLVFTVYPENLGQNKASQKVVISEIVDAPGGRSLRPVSVFQRLDADGGDKLYFPHDATAHVDPATGRVIMDVAYWDLGLVTVDITDPAHPVELAQFDDTGPSAYTRTHLVRVFPGTIGGRTVAVMEPEIASGEDPGQYTFVDLTDPERPQKLGHWRLPGDHVVDQPFIFSPHNFDLACDGNGQVTGRPVDYAAPCEGPTVVLGHFHGGLWALDASDPTAPRAAGFFFPEIGRSNVGTGFPHPGFFGAYAVDGHVYAGEWWTGLHVLPLPRTSG